MTGTESRLEQTLAFWDRVLRLDLSLLVLERMEVEQELVILGDAENAVQEAVAVVAQRLSGKELGIAVSKKVGEMVWYPVSVAVWKRGRELESTSAW